MKSREAQAGCSIARNCRFKEQVIYLSGLIYVYLNLTQSKGMIF